MMIKRYVLMIFIVSTTPMACLAGPDRYRKYKNQLPSELPYALQFIPNKSYIKNICSQNLTENPALYSHCKNINAMYKREYDRFVLSECYKTREQEYRPMVRLLINPIQEVRYAYHAFVLEKNTEHIFAEGARSVDELISDLSPHKKYREIELLKQGLGSVEFSS